MLDLKTMREIEEGVRIELMAGCHLCKLRHPIHATPATWLNDLDEWRLKHIGHPIEFTTPRRVIPRRLPRFLERIWEAANLAPWWLRYSENSNIKLAYGTAAAYTITLASLAASSTRVQGREGTAVSNVTNLFLDYQVSGKITAGTSPTAGLTELWMVGSLDDTPTYPDVFTGADAAATVTSRDILAASLGLVGSVVNDTTSNRAYYFRPTSLASLFGFMVPPSHTPWVTHSMVAALHATGGNHYIKRVPVYATSA